MEAKLAAETCADAQWFELYLHDGKQNTEIKLV
jgi:hypothetical protein